MNRCRVLFAVALTLLGCSTAETRHTVLPPAEAARLNDPGWTLLKTPKTEFKRIRPATDPAAAPRGGDHPFTWRS